MTAVTYNKLRLEASDRNHPLNVRRSKFVHAADNITIERKKLSF